ncbi:MAG TPA: tetratricopeptide repeat protein [Chloroflexota bacterium]|nr:tetratricopeptide repeat protein [Chloroflexota bacterium]
MDVEEQQTTEISDEERRSRRRQMGQQAIALAMQSRWQEAVDLNRQIVDIAPDDDEALNRLGKALTELGKIGDARQAYEQALGADPANMIAQRNLERLSRISEVEAGELARRAAAVKLDPRFFTEETGKTAITLLEQPAKSEVLATLSAGEEVRLEPENGELFVSSMDGTYVGRVTERLATRLLRLMQSGNAYRAGVVGEENNTARIIIRETVQSPQNAGRISFPPQVQTLPRPYLREGLLRRASASSDEDDDEELDVDVNDIDSDEDEDEASEFGFHESVLDES